MASLAHRCPVPYSIGMETPSSRALVPAGAPVPRRRTGGMNALARAVRSPGVRRATAAGVAFALGFQLSRVLRAGRLWRLGSSARHAYRTVTGDESPTAAWSRGGWAWRSLTVVAVAYRAARSDERG